MSDCYIDVNHNTVKPRYIFFKSYQINDNNLCKLSDVLSNTQWNDLTDIHDANTAYDMFMINLVKFIMIVYL